MADFVYPGATHTRYSHSLGVLNLADRMIQSLELNSKDFVISIKERSKLRLAALLHDIGHYPFSHPIENVMKTLDKERGSHEYNSQVFILETEVADILKKYEFKPKEISGIIRRKRTNKFVVLNQIISSDLDADRLDYLLRDSHHCGVAYGQFDLNRLLNVLVAKNNRLYVNSKGRHAVEGYLLARYQMFNQVYVHKAVFGFELLLQKAYESLMNAGILPTLKEIQKNPVEFFDFDDIMVMNTIKQVAKGKGKFTQDVPEFGIQACERIYRREPLKIACYHSWFQSPSEQSDSQTRIIMGISSFVQDEDEINKIVEAKGFSKEWIIEGEVYSGIMKLHPRFGNVSDTESETEEDTEEYDDSIWLFNEETQQIESLSEDKSSILQQLAGRKLTTICVYTLPELVEEVQENINNKILEISGVF